MRNKYYGLFVFFAFFWMAVTILICLTLSPWFNWQVNALSDFGNTDLHNGETLSLTVAWVFNFGLAFIGVLLFVYARYGLRFYAKKTSYYLTLSALALIGVGIFNVSYGVLHIATAVAAFITMITATFYYAFERRSVLAFFVILGMLPWLLYGAGMINTGPAILEIISGISFAPWVIESALAVLKMQK